MEIHESFRYGKGSGQTRANAPVIRRARKSVHGALSRFRARRNNREEKFRGKPFSILLSMVTVYQLSRSVRESAVNGTGLSVVMLGWRRVGRGEHSRNGRRRVEGRGYFGRRAHSYSRRLARN